MADALDIEHVRSVLLQTREQLRALQEARDAAAATVELDQSSVGRLSRMYALQQQALGQNSQQCARQALLRIEAALRRCDEGSNGDCLDCDEPIEPRRLQLDPANPFCLRCAAARERLGQ